jgi:3-hydroxyacyl-CoA dehydrogenase
MRLLEIVRGAATGKEVIATCMQLAKKLEKVGVLVGNCMGFVGNRMFGPYRREAQFLVEEGASVTDVDDALYDFGMAMGPLATGDLAAVTSDGASVRKIVSCKSQACARRLSKIVFANWAALGKKPALAGTNMMRIGSPLPMPKSPGGSPVEL